MEEEKKREEIKISDLTKYINPEDINMINITNDTKDLMEYL